MVVDDPYGARAQLRKWQALHGREDKLMDILVKEHPQDFDAPSNMTPRLPADESLDVGRRQEEDSDEPHLVTSTDSVDITSSAGLRVLNMGDLVEIRAGGGGSSILAIFIRQTASSPSIAQVFCLSGRTAYVSPSKIVFASPGWADLALVNALLPHLPAVESQADVQELKEIAVQEDISVPRAVSAPLVNKLTEFHQEVEETYRINAKRLDHAHEILAHETDLRFGSLTSIAAALLSKPNTALSPSDLFTTRRAILNGGIRFQTEQSFRLTGYVQISSKEEVRQLEKVRDWIRAWQDDLADTSSHKFRSARNYKNKSAVFVHDFIRKAKELITERRRHRQPIVEAGNIGIAVNKFHGQRTGGIPVFAANQFDGHDQSILRLIKAWCCEFRFRGTGGLQSLPPLLLQATGLYPDSSDHFGESTGFIFLQELGVIAPWENRSVFHTGLLLPGSNYQRPLEDLVQYLERMGEEESPFKDTMSDLRHDWGDLPVYCIDDAGSHEIDDGISIQKAEDGKSGNRRFWVHVHIANPTAFLAQDHPISMFARHMAETVYMPDRVFKMMPSWATSRHFSLAPNKPCLTVSALVNDKGEIVDTKIRNAFVRNVISMTKVEVDGLFESADNKASPTQSVSITCGAKTPPELVHQSDVSKLSDSDLENLRMLHQVGKSRAAIRTAAGGLFFEMHRPSVSVWDIGDRPGLNHSFYHGRGTRSFYGDPIISMNTSGFINWFKHTDRANDTIVRECMLLACEAAGQWCAQRQIPILYRGTIPQPHLPDPEIFWREKIVPNMKPNGEVPFKLARDYMFGLGFTVLRTTPLKHDLLGLDHYTKVTSPLRRYGDMLVHWQIEAALRQEATTGQSLVQNDATAIAGRKRDDKFLPFSASKLANIAVGLQPRESAIMRIKNEAELHWLHLLLFRKHYFPELSGGPLSATIPKLHVLLQDESPRLRGRMQGTLLEMNLFVDVDMTQVPEVNEMCKGSVWECEIQAVDVYHRNITMKPIKKLVDDGWDDETWRKHGFEQACAA